MRRIAIAATLVVITACTPASDSSSPTRTSSSSPSPATSPRHEDATTAQYRAAVTTSLADQKTAGLTETWQDSSGRLTLVQAYDPDTGTAASHDAQTDAYDQIDPADLMPQRLLDELDSLGSGEGYDIGAVTSPSPGVFRVTNQYADEPYQVTYTLDNLGRISTATVTGSADISGTAQFQYLITSLGHEALVRAGD